MLGREAKAWRVDHVFGGEEGMDVTCDEAVTRAPVRSWTESDCDCDYDDTRPRLFVFFPLLLFACEPLADEW